MPLYEYQCPGIKAGKKKADPHKFEKIVSIANGDKPQVCPDHDKLSSRIDISTTSPFVWGMNEIHWSAGLGSNPNGMNHAKKQ